MLKGFPLDDVYTDSEMCFYDPASVNERDWIISEGSDCHICINSE